VTNSAANLTGLRILLIEDEPLLALWLEDILIELGAVVIGTAVTVAEAMAAIVNDPPEAVILDMNLQGMSAVPVATFLEERSIKFIITTGGYVDPSRELEFAGAPMLAKPYSHDQLAKALIFLLVDVAAACAEAQPKKLSTCSTASRLRRAV
jgi:DNA-binding response OmpR family regulator